MSETLRDGRFVRLGPLGEGSQGATFDGVDKKEGRAVAIKRFDDDSVAFEGMAGEEVESADTGEQLHIVDFTDLRADGVYYVDVEGVARSAPFKIAEDVFVEPFMGAMLGMYGLRCGTSVQFSWQGAWFGHGECHENDVAPGGYNAREPQPGLATSPLEPALALTGFRWAS